MECEERENETTIHTLLKLQILFELTTLITYQLPIQAQSQHCYADKTFQCNRTQGMIIIVIFYQTSLGQDKFGILFKSMQLVNRSLFSFAKVGFVGLGNMGFPMAVNLARKGHEVYAYDINPAKEEDARKHNMIFRNSIRHLAKDANVFITIVPTPADAQKVCQSEQGLFKHASPDSLIIDSSTITPSVSAALAESAKKHSMTYVDAPVTGGVTGSAAGTLSFLVGAPDQALFERVKPILEAMGKNFFNCGKPGAGQIAKICNNMALAIQMISISQALAMGHSLGLDAKTLSHIMKASSSRCWSIDTYNPVPGFLENVPAANDYEGGFRCQLMLKDLGLAQLIAQEAGINSHLGKLTKQLYEKLASSGYANKDFGAVFHALANKKL